MSQRWLLCPFRLRTWTPSLLLLCLIVAALLATISSDAKTAKLKVDENNVQVLLTKNPAEVRLPIQNFTLQKQKVLIHLEFVDTQEKVIAQAASSEEIEQTKTASVSVPFSAAKLNASERKQLLWMRLRYKLSTDVSPTPLAQGTLSFSRIAPELFEVRVATSYMAREGADYRVRVQAVNPITIKPVSGVRIAGDIVLENDDRDVHLEAFGITNSLGYAILSFQIPKRFPLFPHEFQPDGGELHITAQRGVLLTEFSGGVYVDQFPRILVTTDKPIYQPGQLLHTRALVFSPSRKPLANQDVVVKIYDHEDVTVFQKTMTTSKFGIVSCDWSIASNTKLGPYSIRVGFGESDQYWEIGTVVMVTRYELPNFSVNVKPDRKYYLTRQDAEVRVSADYLFGEPVARAHVRVVRESDRHWDYDEQKYVADEEESFEGDTDANGVFLARIDLTEHHESLADSYESDRFDDINYAAYVTDLSTNRTEQRRFDLRVTKERIHVYVVEAQYYHDQTGKLPLNFFVSTFYADGSPVECTVNLKVPNSNETPALRYTIKTNRYGFGKIAGLSLPKSVKLDDAELAISARDAFGNRGTAKEDLNFDDSQMLTIETGKSLYRPGESVTAVFSANFPDQVIVVELANQQRVLASEPIQLRNGHARFTFPYSSDFQDKLSIAAYPDFPNSSSAVATHSILYPQNRELKVEAIPAKGTYQPGETAQVSLLAKAFGDSQIESALGVVVIDRAVEERVKTDRDFGRNYNGSWQSFIESSEQTAGITLNDLRRTDMSKRVPADLELIAEVILNQSSVYSPRFLEGDSFDSNAGSIFSKSILVTLSPVRKALANHYSTTYEYPRDKTALRRILQSANLNLDDLRDPWGVQFRPVFEVNKHSDVFQILSAGADKQFDTHDDFIADSLEWPYFRIIGAAIDDVIQTYHRRTGGFIRDKQTLSEELTPLGINLEKLRDPWGTPYLLSFDVARSSYVLKIQSAGPDRVLVQNPTYRDDDFLLWTSTIDYFFDTRIKISTALTRWTTQKRPFPSDANAFAATLRESQIDLSKIPDSWGRPYDVSFRLQTLYTDRIQVEGKPQSEKMSVTPITQTVQLINLRSRGADGKPNTSDDFDIATFSGVISEAASATAVRTQVGNSIVMTDGTGSIAGFVTDTNGAAVANAKVLATTSDQTVETTTKEDGSFAITNLAPGRYEILVTAPGFKNASVSNLLVVTSTITNANVGLEPGETTETVQVTSSAATIQTQQINSLPINTRNFSALRSKVNVITKSGTPDFTPRVRDYFPETLLWQPELTTDKNGRAQVDFKLADNITTWKLSVIGSNENGEIGTTETEIRAFQPFFAELDPPRVLTEGDRISLPVVIRNYLDRKQLLNLELKPESWFTLLENNRKQTNVGAGDSTKQTFELRTINSVIDGKQRVTAIGSSSSDAIEKVVTVHPDGEERTETNSDILDRSTKLAVELPNDTVAKSAHVELKIYPNLSAHIGESVEGVMQRPYGCAEQTISATYPSLILLQLANEAGSSSATLARARRYVELGYQKLRGYQLENGGFTYWGRGDADIALSAYALRFFTDAKKFTVVSPALGLKTREWLLKQQSPDGSWPAPKWNGSDQSARTAMLTALVARAIAQATSSENDAAPNNSVKRSVEYLRQQSERSDEPYLIASFSLVTLLAGNSEEAQRVNERLRSLVHSESNRNYWDLQTNTPFYGWGRAGRLETTALALQALLSSQQPDNDKLINGALLFLLHNKDRYGVWYSTQATVNVLEAMGLFLNQHRKDLTSKGSSVEVVVNERPFKIVQVSSDNQMFAPETVDLTSAVSVGSNQIELRSSAGMKTASVQIVSNYYVPWRTASPIETSHIKSGDAEAITLETRFDKREARVMDVITCHVKAERIGFRGYGMLLAEIGLPPGADVDRASLQAAMTGSGWSIDQYDVLPDRVVVYLWPRAGGTEFEFKFRPRMAMTAKSSPSSIYDYYNPDAKAVVGPGTFVIK